MRNVIKTAAGLALAIAFGMPAVAQDTLTIGIMVPTTGSEAIYGQDMANAVNLAIDEINKAGGVLGKQLTSTIGDDGCDAQLAVNADSKLAASGVVGVVGGFAGGSPGSVGAGSVDPPVPGSGSAGGEGSGSAGALAVGCAAGGVDGCRITWLPATKEIRSATAAARPPKPYRRRLFMMVTSMC